MIHEQRALLDPLRHHHARGQSTVDVVGFDPIVIDKTGLLRVHFGHPHHRATPVQGQHQEVIGIGAVDTPFLMWGDEVQDDMRAAFGRIVVDRLGDGFQIHRRAIADKAFAKGPHPQVILIKLLAAGQGAPRDQLMDVGIARVVADVLAFDA